MKTPFNYNETNYTYDVLEKIYTTPAIYVTTSDISDFYSKYMKGVKPIFYNSKSTRPFINKTIDFCYLNESHGFWFIGFTDNTFIIREKVSNKDGDTWQYAYTLNMNLCVSVENAETNSVKITSIGRWIEEHTNADIIGFYEAIKKEVEIRNIMYEKFKEENEHYQPKERSYVLGLI